MTEEPQIKPQITYYREYQLKDSEFVDAKLDFDETNPKGDFERALFKKIFGITEIAERDGKVQYGIGQPKGENGRKYIFGVIYLNTYKKTAESEPITVNKIYIFIYGAKELPAKGILRAHQIVQISNTEMKTNTTDQLGLFSGTTCIVGINKENNKYYFYLPSKSFCLEGSHRDIVELPTTYEGKFEISIPQ